jgi:pimeloyl-ACP methyl ester carboxylesterase
MLVGLSQGGMDAQNLASAGENNVSTLMTYGTPIIRADDPTIATAHIRAEGDPVPVFGERRAAARRAATNPLSGCPYPQRDSLRCGSESRRT